MLRKNYHIFLCFFTHHNYWVRPPTAHWTWPFSDFLTFITSVLVGRLSSFFFKRSAWHQTKFLLEAFLNFFLVREILTFYCFSIFFFVLLCIFFKVKIRNRQNPLTKTLPVHLGLLINFNYIKKMNRVGVIKVYVEWDDIFFVIFSVISGRHFQTKSNLAHRLPGTLRITMSYSPWKSDQWSGQKFVNSARMSEEFIKNTSEHKSKYKTSESTKRLAKWSKIAK